MLFLLWKRPGLLKEAKRWEVSMPDKDNSLCKSPEVGKNMFVGKTGWRVEIEGEGILRSSWSRMEG